MPAPRFTLPLAMSDPTELFPLAIAAEESGFDAVALPDSAFFPETVSAAYPYSPTGDRFWSGETPFVDPLVAIAAMAAVTTRLEFLTNVLKLPIRDPLLLAKQVASIASLSENRLLLGVGLAWIPEEFAWTGTTMATRGARADEAIEILRRICSGDGPRWVEFHGRHYDFDRLMISPVPTAPLPILVGGHSEAALARAARLGDGWVSTAATLDDLRVPLERLLELRSEHEQSVRPFVVSCLAVDVEDLDGCRRLADLGVTDIQIIPWLDQLDTADLEAKCSAVHRFGEQVLARF